MRLDAVSLGDVLKFPRVLCCYCVLFVINRWVLRPCLYFFH